MNFLNNEIPNRSIPLFTANNSAVSGHVHDCLADLNEEEDAFLMSLFSFNTENMFTSRALSRALIIAIFQCSDNMALIMIL